MLHILTDKTDPQSFLGLVTKANINSNDTWSSMYLLINAGLMAFLLFITATGFEEGTGLLEKEPTSSYIKLTSSHQTHLITSL